MSKVKYLHFTIGPVQGFVAQARRTRDLWAGSFLLSYLAGQAMYAVYTNGGKVVFPVIYGQDGQPCDPLMKAIKMNKDNMEMKTGPQEGTLPNRFKAEVPVGFDPCLCVNAVQDTWKKIADVVREKYIDGVSHLGKDTNEIWKSQVDNFWDISWVITESKDGNDLLNLRKNWFSHVPTEEGGDKCSLMGNRQEISGFIRSWPKERVQQDNFWRAVSEKTDTFNIKVDERLCAVSLIKRLFPLVAEQAIGWSVPQKYPSNTYISAVHWIEKVLMENKSETEKFIEIVESCDLAKSSRKEYETQIQCLQDNREQFVGAAKFIKLDGDLFFETTLKNHRFWPPNTVSQREQLLGVIKDMAERPSPFYAVLLMDGDNIGSLLRESVGEISEISEIGEIVSQALADFSGVVQKYVKENNGVLLYAGGDDVLALLPLEDALNAAKILRQQYGQAFSKTTIPIKRTTISAAIVYAHHHAPLKLILNEAHRLLDEVAKDKTGRDSLAVGVWKTAGKVLEWSAPWDIIVDKENSCLIDQLISDFRNKVNSGQPEQKQHQHFNSTFFYNIRKRFDVLSGDTGLFSSTDAVDLLTAEYMKNRERDKIQLEQAKERIERLITLCRIYCRVDGVIQPIKAGVFNVDGAILLRFLAEKGVI